MIIKICDVCKKEVDDLQELSDEYKVGLAYIFRGSTGSNCFVWRI